MFLAFLRTAWTFLKMIPWQVWAILGALAAAVVYTLWIDHRAYERGERHATEKYERIRLAEREAQIKADQAASFALSQLTERLDRARVDEEKRLQDAEIARRDEVKRLEGRFHALVSATQLARCPDVPRGFLRFWTEASAFANGRVDSAPAPASAESLDPPSGVPLPAVASTITGQAGAYKACAERQAGWLKYHEQVNEWAKEVNKIMADQ